VNPIEQIQLNPQGAMFWHKPPFWHGDVVHLSTTELQFEPLHPQLQEHEYNPGPAA
jgi:hypothetical protein